LAKWRVHCLFRNENAAIKFRDFSNFSTEKPLLCEVALVAKLYSEVKKTET